MIPFSIDIHGDIEFQAFNKRSLNKALKPAMQKGAMAWHEKILSRHFKRSAYAEYPGAYPRRKRRGDPFKRTGKLMDTMRRKNSLSISGSAKSITLRVKTGRPIRFTKDQERARTFIIMEELNLSFKSANRKLWSQTGYGAKRQKEFQRGIAAINRRDEREIAAVIRAELLKNYEKIQKEKKQKRMKIK